VTLLQVNGGTNGLTEREIYYKRWLAAIL